MDWAITVQICEMLIWVLQWNPGRLEKFCLPQAVMFTNVLMRGWIYGCWYRKFDIVDLFVVDLSKHIP